MKLDVYVSGRQVAVLDSVGDFKSVLTYLPDAARESLVSLTMPVRTESYLWDDQIHPIFQMNLPEGYLLQVLQEEFGPHITGSPLALLSVIGRNMIGRLQVAPPGAKLDEPAKPVDVATLLKGDNSEEAFTQLVREHATSGVSGVLPKFLDVELENSEIRPKGFGPHKKVSMRTHRHIIKGSSSKLPFATINEYLCMQVVSKVIPAATTELSEDGNVLVVNRFDIDEEGKPHYGMEDFCALLGLRPAQKYDTTWERIAKAVRDHVEGGRQYETFKTLTIMLLLTYALRNGDCHSKNLALLYTSPDDAQLSPAYDFLTTSVYAGSQNNPPGISFAGKKTWRPGRNLGKFITTRFGIPAKEQREMVDRISDAVSDTAPNIREMMKRFPGFNDTGKRMLATWSEEVMALRDSRTYDLHAWNPGDAFERISDPPKLASEVMVIGKSPLLSNRSGLK